MTDPEKLSRTTRSEFGRNLLQSAEGDHSAPGAAQRALLAVSAGAVVVGGTSAATAASSAASASGKWAGTLMLKWLGLGLLAGTTTLVSVDYAARRSPSPPAPAVLAAETQHAVASVSNATQPVPGPELPAPASAPASAQAEVRHAPSTAPTLPERAPAEPTFDPPSESSSRALSELQAIRSALAAHAPERALALLAGFEQRANAASFAEESSVLRIQALADAGRASDARGLASDFLSRYPRSAYAERVRAKVQLP